MQAASGFEIAREPTDAVVLIKLGSIEYQSTFHTHTPVTILTTVWAEEINSNQNWQETYGVSPGEVTPVDEFIFQGVFPGKCNQDVGKIMLRFKILGNDGHPEDKQFVGFTEGDNALTTSGIYYFTAPIQFEEAGLRFSYILRGRIDVSC